MRIATVAASLLAVAAACSPAAPPTAPPQRADPQVARPPTPRTFTHDEYDAHIAALRTRLATLGLEHLAIRIEEPFVVVGDGTPDALARSAQTVRWAADALEAHLFDTRPTKILDIFLFSNERSYTDGVTALTGEAPTTPYGFYSHAHPGLYMNIATGGGTLVHEIVHPYVEADFPGAPAWLNEGLGSLYEQSAERRGHIVGLTNWRLAGLQRGIARGTVPSFQALATMSDTEFYEEARGTNYAQARYLMYWLQEHDLLQSFYRAFRANRATDPTGYQTLVHTLGDRDMTTFAAEWARYVTALRFP